MKRTVCLASLPLNQGKREELQAVIASATDCKRRFVEILRIPRMWHHLDNKRGFRDWAKAQGLYSKDMNVHLVDQAAFDAVDTCKRHIESVVKTTKLKTGIWHRFTDENERHYAYGCLVRYSAIGIIMCGGTPCLTAGNLNAETQKTIARYLHRMLRNGLGGTWPTVHLTRSMALDETLYRSFIVERAGATLKRRQYVSVVGHEARKRINIPLAGLSRVSGNIRVVLDKDEERAFIHVVYDMLPLPGPATGTEVAIDWGITEVCTDDAGVKHGKDYGKVLIGATEQRNKTGKERGRLWPITKKNAGSKRAKHIARNNLGTLKQAKMRRRTQAALRTISGAAVKEVVYGESNRTRARGKPVRDPSKRPKSLIIEDLSHLRGKAKSKKISRMCSSWARNENEERMTVHAYLGGSEVKTVNAAYTSQTCPDPNCGYVEAQNRDGDRFHCRNPHWECNWQGDADHVAAMNLKTRINDCEIHRFTPHMEVKKILEDRFLRRMESGRGGQLVELSNEPTATAHGRTPSKPRRVFPDVGDELVSCPDTDSQSPVPTDGTGETQRLESEKKRSA